MKCQIVYTFSNNTRFIKVETLRRANLFSKNKLDMQESRRPWTAEVCILFSTPFAQQDEAVRTIVGEIGLKNWPEVSSLMIKQYNVQGRSGKQCRERYTLQTLLFRWYNQLSPQVNKRPWTIEEQKLLFEAHKKHRNKWIDISKLFEGRTDNSIKNHFYSTIRRSLRRICKLLGNKNSTSQLRSIKPSILSEIFEYSEMKDTDINSQNQDIVNDSKAITEQLLNFAHNKPKASEDSSQLTENKKNELQNILEKLSEFSRIYEERKHKENILKSEQSANSPSRPSSLIKKHAEKKLQSNPVSELISPSELNQSSLSDEEYDSTADPKESKKAKSFKTAIIKKPNRNPKMQNPINSSKATKESIYDWEEFLQRCEYVKLYCQTPNIAPKLANQVSSFTAFINENESSQTSKSQKENSSDSKQEIYSGRISDVEMDDLEPSSFLSKKGEAFTFSTPRSGTQNSFTEQKAAHSEQFTAVSGQKQGQA